MAPSASPLKSVPSSEIAVDHVHVVGEVCPTCDQPIPNEKLEEVRKRAEAREKAQEGAITARLQSEFARTKALDDAKAQAAIEEARREGREALDEEQRAAAAKEAAAREEGKKQAAAEASEQLALARQALDQFRTSAEAQLKQAGEEKAAAEQNREALQAELEKARAEGVAAVEREKQQAADREAQIRGEVQRQADAAANEKIEAAQRVHQESAAALNERLQAAEAEKAAAEQAAADTKAVLEEQRRTLTEERDTRLQEVREAMEQDKATAVNAEKAAAFETTQKLSDEIAKLQRDLAKKTAEQLGEGAEVVLFEALRAAYPDDKIDRVGRGAPGADILHTVMHNRKECGKIIYDSKNHKAWRSDFVTKLAADQMSAKVDHAVLSVHKFPSGASQLHEQDGVIVANPARVVAVVHLLRRNVISAHTRRLGNEERTKKTAVLYAFMTSERCNDLFKRIERHTDALLDLQVADKKYHDNYWDKQGRQLNSILRVHAELGREVDGIIGTADLPETGDE